MEAMNKVLIPNGGEGVQAEYREQTVSDYRYNPYIEALPTILSQEEVIDHLAFYPPFDPSERQLETHVRFHLVQRVFQYFQPLSMHLDLESRISRLIRQGYVYRNPVQPGFVEQMNGGQDWMRNRNVDLSRIQGFRTTQSALTLIGPSGLGKSTAINRILAFYPQVIVHSNYRGMEFSQYQLVWLKLDCPYDGSIKGLTIDFFRNVDLLLGTRYYKQYGSARYPISALQPAMAQISRTYGLGLLVIDEIQHLSTAKSQGSEKMLNYFVTLVNTIGIPVVLVGTNKAIGVLQSQFRQARRGSGQGDMVWERMKRDASWDLLLEGMWDNQWVRHPVPLTPELSAELYDLSQGITDIAVKIFVMAQIRAMSTGKETLSASLFRQVAKENLQLVQPMIDALRSGDLRKVAQYEDIRPIDLGQFMEKESSSIRINEKIRELQVAKKKQTERQALSIEEESIVKLVELEIPPGIAKRLVKKVMEGKGTLTVPAVVKTALALHAQAVTEQTDKRSTSQGQAVTQGDIRILVADGKKRGLTAYQALKDNGIIRPTSSDPLFVMG
ncbi:ATP-binding protein [Alicyclobacillus acidiphilus]|uniref:ATP-binding protein n=1 Tax=Alicyclobacillus acidiphilus TaxID=182455 RepID=UPI000AEC343E|nr:ATP-binding protein [Alicyclobacillus acidiphilus]